MNISAFKDILKQELPIFLKQDPSLKIYILELTRHEYADRLETQDRFEQILTELRQDRELQARKWEEQDRKWEEQNRKWEEQNRKWDEYMAASRQEWNEYMAARKQEWDQYMAAQNKKWDEQNDKWKANQAEIDRWSKKLDRTVTSIGARWGMKSERSFRNALAGILEEDFGVKVLNVNEFDDAGEVFGRPDQIELDIIIKNGLLIICELKSHIDKGGIHIFERKARFYERRHQRQAKRLIVISPMVDQKAQFLAEELGIEVYSDAIEIEKI